MIVTLRISQTELWFAIIKLVNIIDTIRITLIASHQVIWNLAVGGLSVYQQCENPESWDKIPRKSFVSFSNRIAGESFVDSNYSKGVYLHKSVQTWVLSLPSIQDDGWDRDRCWPVVPARVYMRVRVSRDRICSTTQPRWDDLLPHEGGGQSVYLWVSYGPTSQSTVDLGGLQMSSNILSPLWRTTKCNVRATLPPQGWQGK